MYSIDKRMLENWWHIIFYSQLILLKTAWLQYNSHTKEVTHLKYTSQWFSVYSVVQPLLQSNFRTFYHSLKKKKKQTNSSSHPFISSHPHSSSSRPGANLYSVSTDLPVLPAISNICILLLKNYYYYYFLPCHTVCMILVLWPGIELRSPAVEAWSLTCWTARDVPGS